MVYVLDFDNKPLMPTKRHGKIKHLLKTGKATVVQRTPFTVRLTYNTTDYKQDITLGVDAGSKTIGISATTKTQELYAAEATLRTDIVDLIATKAQYRRTRRNRKTRYRKARFDNRKRPSGWLAPSIRQKIDSHLKVISDIHKILPITHVIIETASFDIQKLKDDAITGYQYQQGNQLGFWNVREYIFFRDGHKCQHCHGKSKDKILNVHHLESRKTGGDAPNNLITLCETCHDLYHKGKIILKIKRGASYRDAAFMGIMRWAVFNKLRELHPTVNMTYGYITKNTRIRNNLEKSHRIDARCISGNPLAKPLDYHFNQKFVRKHNRQIHKATIYRNGYRKINQSPKYMFDYQLFDAVQMQNRQTGFIFARRASGSFDIRKLTGEKLSAGISYKKLRPLQKRKTILTERTEAPIPLHS